MFPESILTKLSANRHIIKSLENKMVENKPREIFKPTGGLFNCKSGCGEKSGKHIGGPCNLCKYKEMAAKESSRLGEKERKNSLMRSMERRESP
jgi:hypothetical protein